MPRGIPNVKAESQAKNYVAAPVNAYEAQEQQVGQDAPRVMKSTGPARDALESAGFQVVDRPVDLEKLAMLAFMEEPVTVFIHQTADKNAEKVFEIFNNGQVEIFRRGETKTVKRKFVNELATRKITTYTQERRQNTMTGIMEDVQLPSTALRYPFSVTEDGHPRGRDWLDATLAMP